MPLFTGDEFTRELDDLTVGLSRVLFPIVVLLGLNGLWSGSSTPTTTSRSRRSRRWSGTS